MTTDSKHLLIRWLIVCLIPLITLLAFVVFPPADHTQYLINGIILACEATFLFKFVLFDVIKFHLKQDGVMRRKTAWQFAPIVVLIVYLFHYFGAF
ncbi:hypothetical protein [Neisseria perflava]|uniref:hypothetical protein n=1 Tax=Neisseria perflava TaxID=33053 RepID=UPI0020A19734|nr:hypothetical protein [Neisseria perflava]MCP1659541.1 hypothetical protein [Neisseria perflava]